MKKAIVFFAMLILISSVALALNPVVVGPTGDYAIIEDAIDSWCVGGANSAEAAPFVIEIDPAGSYDESLTLNDGNTSGAIVGDLEIKSSVPGTLPVIKLQTGITGGGDGLHIYQSTFNVTFTDLLFCPSLTNPVIDDFIKIDENTALSTDPNNIEFYNCIFTDVDVAGDPAVSSKADIIAMDYPSSITAFVSGSSFASGGMLMKWWGDAGENLSGKIVNCGFWVKLGYCARINLDGSSGETFLIEDSVFANGGGWHAAIQAAPNNAGSSFVITGSQDPCVGDLEKCTAILSAGWHAIWGGGPAGASVTIDNVLIDVEDVWGTDSPSRPLSNGSSELYVEDCIFNTRGDTSFILDYPTKPGVPDIFNRCTIHYEDTTPGAWLYTGYSPDPGAIKFIDCSISGNGVGAWTTVPPDMGVELINCNIATSGADAITTLGLNPITFTDCKFVDPAYVSKDRKVEGYMDPTNPALLYAGAWEIGTVGGVSLGGGGNYRGPDASDMAANAFKDWGDCEGPIFTIPSGRSNWTTPTLPSVQKQERGVIGLGLLVNHTTGRLEAGTDEEDISGFVDGGEQFSFFYKIPTVMYSYPRVALRLDPNDPPFGGSDGQSGDVDGVTGGVIVWQNVEFIIDNNWHIYRADVDALDFGVASTANFYTNNYAVPEWSLDEIVLTDGPETLTEVQDWGLF